MSEFETFPSIPEGFTVAEYFKSGVNDLLAKQAAVVFTYEIPTHDLEIVHLSDPDGIYSYVYEAFRRSDNARELGLFIKNPREGLTGHYRPRVSARHYWQLNDGLVSRAEELRGKFSSPLILDNQTMGIPVTDEQQQARRLLAVDWTNINGQRYTPVKPIDTLFFKEVTLV